MIPQLSLMLDDIQDNSDFRKFQPTAHKKFGTEIVAHSMFYLLSMAYSKIEEFISSDKIAQSLLMIHKGMVEGSIGMNRDFFARDDY